MAVLVAATMLISFAACGCNDAEKTIAAEKTTAEKTEASAVPTEKADIVALFNEATVKAVSALAYTISTDAYLTNVKYSIAKVKVVTGTIYTTVKYSGFSY